jgi:hypothetical protein
MHGDDRKLLEELKAQFKAHLEKHLTNDVVERLGAAGDKLKDGIEEILMTLEECLSADRLTNGDCEEILTLLASYDETFDRIDLPSLH